MSASERLSENTLFEDFDTDLGEWATASSANAASADAGRTAGEWGDDYGFDEQQSVEAMGEPNGAAATSASAVGGATTTMLTDQAPTSPHSFDLGHSDLDSSGLATSAVGETTIDQPAASDHLAPSGVDAAPSHRTEPRISHTTSARPTNILDPGFDLTLRPMRYPVFYDMYRDAIKNTWTVDEIDFSEDLVDLDRKLLPAERHLVSRLVAFFATGDSIVANNLVLNLYQHINAPEARMYLSRQLYEEALHVQFYLTLLDNYIPDIAEREAAFAAIENIPSIRAKAEFCFKWLDSISDLDKIETPEDRKKFLMNLICFAATIEGLFFFAAFAYVYFLRSKGLLNGLADGTNWVFRDESCHMNFAFEVVNTVRAEEPELFDAQMEADVRQMLHEAIDCEHQFAADVLGEGIPGMSLADTRTYLEYVADQRLVQLGYSPEFGVKNPFTFMELQDVQGLSNFFERTVSSYQVGVSGDVSFEEEF